MADTAILKAQLATLESVLTALDSTRGSLPALLRSFALPASSPAQRSSIYRSYSSQCTLSIQQLSDALLAAEGVLNLAGESEILHGAEGVVVRPRLRTDEGWERVAGLMSAKIDSAKGKARAGPFENSLLPREGPSSPGELKDQLETFARAHNNISRVEVDPRGDEVRLELRALMRCVLMLRWSESAEDEMEEDAKVREERRGRICHVERVACFGVKESRSAYLQSQHSLHQSLTNQAMVLIESSRQRSTYRERSNLEQVLAFLADPPLPF